MGARQSNLVHLLVDHQLFHAILAPRWGGSRAQSLLPTTEVKQLRDLIRECLLVAYFR